MLVTYATLFPEARESTTGLISVFVLNWATESFRVAFDDLIDSMEDEAADQRDERKITNGNPCQAHHANQAVAGASSQQTTDYTIPLVPGITHCSASSTWQQKVLGVEAKLQVDLQQDLARSVPEKVPDEETNASSA